MLRTRLSQRETTRIPTRARTALAALLTLLAACTDPGLCALGTEDCPCRVTDTTNDSEPACDGGLICREDQCVVENLLCTIPEGLAPGQGGDQIIPLSCPSLDFGNGLYDMTEPEARERLCEAFCQRKDWFCNDSCNPQDCAQNSDSARSVLEKIASNLDCALPCQNALDRGLSLECMTCACEALVFATCENFRDAGACNNGDRCGGAVCTNDCDYPADGACDDGDPDNAAYSHCAWGTDCADCGVRRGSEPACREAGGECLSDSDCCGNQDNAVYCVPLKIGNDEAIVSRCLPRCSENDECPSGTVCEKSREPYVCIPACSDSLDSEAFPGVEHWDHTEPSGPDFPGMMSREDCVSGTAGCPCNSVGGCAGQLVCEGTMNICWPPNTPPPGAGPGCNEGSEGCFCAPGGGCNSGLDCVAGDDQQSYWVCERN